MVTQEDSYENSYMVNIKGIRLLAPDFDAKEILDKTPPLNHLVILACHSQGEEELNKNLANVVAHINDNRESLEERDSTGQTPLIVTAQLGNPQVAKFLLNLGADINAQDKYGNTALHHFINHKEEDGIELLLDRGASLTIKNNFGQNALNVAATNINNNQESGGEEPNITEMLLNKTNDIEARDKDGMTAADVAYKNGNNNTLKILLERGARAPDTSKVKMSSHVSAKKRGKIEELLEPYKDNSVDEESKEQCDHQEQSMSHVLRHKSHHISDLKIPPRHMKIHIRKTMSSGFIGRLFEEEETKCNQR